MKASEYRKMGKVPLETETGATFTVGRISGDRLLTLFADHGVDMTDVNIPPTKALNMAIEIVPEFTTEVAPRDEGNDDILGVEELAFSDLIELFNHILTAGVGEEAMARAKAFRIESPGEVGGAGEPGVRTPPDGGPKAPGRGDSP